MCSMVGARPEELNRASASGECGTILLPSDRALLQLKPRKRYQRGEIVAFMKHADSSSLEDRQTAPLVYGRFVLHSAWFGLHQQQACSVNDDDGAISHENAVPLFQDFGGCGPMCW